MDYVRISFCVTYYNQAEYVKASLDSIMHMQIPYKYEILVGDDGSDDETIEVINNYVHEYPNIIKLFCMPRDRATIYNPIQRASANRLNLVSHALGDYIMFLDGDDMYCEDNFIREAISFLDFHKQFVASMYNFNIIDDMGNSIAIKGVKCKSGKINVEKFIKNRLHVHVGAIVFRNIFTNWSIELLKKTDDFDDVLISVFVFQYGDVLFTDKVVYSYRRNNNGIWTGASSLEQNIINVVDCKSVSNIAPIFIKALKKRYWYDLRKVFHNRKTIKKTIAIQRLEQIKTILIKTNNDLLLSIIFYYDQLTLFNKIKTIMRVVFRRY